VPFQGFEDVRSVARPSEYNGMDPLESNDSHVSNATSKNIKKQPHKEKCVRGDFNGCGVILNSQRYYLRLHSSKKSRLQRYMRI
jgi:hypothetical protein